VQCCQNDILKNDLPELLRDLDMCQKKLDAYLESKRQVFPRFYFCAAADLLKILSNGSDPNELQNDFEKLFDAINKVTFAENNKMNIKSIVQLFAGDEEELEFNEEVECTGNVEEWLGRVEKEMQRSVKARCMAAANDCYGDFTNFVNNFQSQFSLLGLQMLWTTKVTAALEAKQKDRKAEFNKTRDEIVKIMTDLTALCLSDIKSKLVRTKIETLVTIHVHQRN
jgi:dynein heavy chain